MLQRKTPQPPLDVMRFADNLPLSLSLSLSLTHSLPSDAVQYTWLSGMALCVAHGLTVLGVSADCDHGPIGHYPPSRGHNLGWQAIMVLSCAPAAARPLRSPPVENTHRTTRSSIRKPHVPLFIVWIHCVVDMAVDMQMDDGYGMPPPPPACTQCSSHHCQQLPKSVWMEAVDYGAWSGYVRYMEAVLSCANRLQIDSRGKTFP
jgi:hypothetical protein